MVGELPGGREIVGSSENLIKKTDAVSHVAVLASRGRPLMSKAVDISMIVCSHSQANAKIRGT